VLFVSFALTDSDQPVLFPILRIRATVCGSASSALQPCQLSLQTWPLGTKNTTAKLCMHGGRYVMADGSEIDLLTWRVRGHRGSGFELFLCAVSACLMRPFPLY
jgi:hypothetical protein